MCDYSLHAQLNRLAREGEELTLAIFRGGTRGFAALEDYERLCAWEQQITHPKIEWSWKGLIQFLKDTTADEPMQLLTAVCCPPGARLRLDGIPMWMQKNLKLKSTETVTFTQLSPEPDTHRDAVRFENGQEVSLQLLQEKQRAVVLSLPSEPEVELTEPDKLELAVVG